MGGDFSTGLRSNVSSISCSCFSVGDFLSEGFVVLAAEKRDGLLRAGAGAGAGGGGGATTCESGNTGWSEFVRN